MNKLDDQGQVAPDDASARVTEIAELYVSVRNTIRHMIAEIGSPTDVASKPLLTKLSELQSAHLKVLAAEEAFHAQQQANQSDADIDYDALRADIGSQLDRLRAATRAG